MIARVIRSAAALRHKPPARFNWLGALLQWRRRARDRAQLAALSCRELRDIGLTRSDVACEATKPFWRM
jgi:uncharacterized protein YjiS (DUF1127 family)